MSIGNINRENKVYIWIFCCKSAQTLSPNSVSEWQHFTELGMYVKLAKSLSLWRKENNLLKIYMNLKRTGWQICMKRNAMKLFSSKKKKKINFWENINHYCIFYRSNRTHYPSVSPPPNKSSNMINFFSVTSSWIFKVNRQRKYFLVEICSYFRISI